MLNINPKRIPLLLASVQALYEVYSAILASEKTRATEAAIRRVHTAALAAWPGIEAAVRQRYPAPELAAA